MAKTQFQDVVPPEKRSIRDIPIPNSGKRKAPVIITPKIEPINVLDDSYDKKEDSNYESPISPVSAKISELTEKRTGSAYEYYYPKNIKTIPKVATFVSAGRKKVLFGGLIFLVLVLFIFGMMTVFASATLDVTMKTQEVEVQSMPINTTMENTKEKIRYEIIKLIKSSNASLNATKEELVETKSKGKIIIFNDFSTEPQRLIVRTRFESPKGLIFRIADSIIIPGKIVKNGVSTPGSIEVEVFADEAGEKYNLDKTDFTIPGFKNDKNRYKSFYARSSGPMTGGFVGNKKIVLDTERNSALIKLDEELKTSLQKEARTKVTENMVLLEEAIVYEIKDLPEKEDGSSVVLTREATALIILFDRTNLSDNLIKEYKKNYPSWTDTSSHIVNLENLKISEKPDPFSVGEDMIFKISGKVVMVADLDVDAMKNKVLGIEKKDVQSVVNGLNGVVSVKATVKPMWKRSFPDDFGKININILTNSK